MDLTVVKNATCTFCGCVCDDIELHANSERIVEAAFALALLRRNCCGDRFVASGNPSQLKRYIVRRLPTIFGALLQATANRMVERGWRLRTIHQALRGERAVSDGPLEVHDSGADERQRGKAGVTEVHVSAEPPAHQPRKRRLLREGEGVLRGFA